MTAVGLRVKSGYAIAVVLGGTRTAPEPLARRVVQLSDPAAGDTRQPYHSAMFKTEEDAREIARRVRIVERCAARSVADLVSALRLARPVAARGRARAGQAPVRAALVVGSLIDPATVGNPHIRAHAHEGELFRTVLVDALRAHDVSCDVIVDKQLAARAAADLGRQSAAISRTVAAFGKALTGPWRAEEKAAATAAWIALNARAPVRARSTRR
jgi:hypothetical protein